MQDGKNTFRRMHGLWVLDRTSKLDDDTLTSCVAEPGKNCPTEFSSKEGSGWTLRVFKRVKQ